MSDLLARWKNTFGPQNYDALKRTPAVSLPDESSEFQIRPGDHFYKFIEASTFAEAFEIQAVFINGLIPKIKDQVTKYRHTTGLVFEESWEFWHCNEILLKAIGGETKIQQELKIEILKRTKEVSDAFRNFNSKIKFDAVASGQAEKQRVKLANEFLVALSALKLVNTQELVDYPVDLHNYIMGDQEEYVRRGPRKIIAIA